MINIEKIKESLSDLNDPFSDKNILDGKNLELLDSNVKQVKLKIEELTTEEILTRINDGHLDAAIAATPLESDNIKERVLYYEPFVAYVPDNHRLRDKKTLEVSDLDIEDMLSFLSVKVIEDHFSK